MSSWDLALISFFVPGGGQAVFRRWRRGGLWFLFFLGGSLFFLWLLITPALVSPWWAIAWFCTMAVAWVAMLVDAWHAPGAVPGSARLSAGTVASFMVPGLGQAGDRRWLSAGLWLSGYAVLLGGAYYARGVHELSWLNPLILMIGVPLVRWLASLDAYQGMAEHAARYGSTTFMTVGVAAIVNLMILMPALGYLTSACFDVVQIGSDSMKPTLIAPMMVPDTDRAARRPIKVIGGDRVIVDKLTYRWRAPRRGDVALLTSTRSHRVALRVAGVPGQMVQIIPPNVVVDGRKVVDPPIFRQIAEEAGGTMGYRAMAGKLNNPVILRADEYYLLGDNTRGSLDSRVFGPYKRHFIRGRVTKICWPLHRAGEPLGY